MLSFTRVEIDLQALRDNYRTIQDWLGRDVRIMAVVKSDAYGHGIVEVASTLYREGVRSFGVADVQEGVILREAGLEGEIIVLLGPAPESFSEIIAHGLTPVVFDTGTAGLLSRKAQEAGSSVGVHLKVDMGMGRLGVMPDELSSLLRFVGSSPGIYAAGILSHFPLAEEEGPGQTEKQLEQFNRTIGQLRDIQPSVISHIANSAALFRNVDSHLDMVRPGITLYGCYPGGLGNISSPVRLRTAMSMKTRILQVKDLPAGYGVSYGHTFITRRPTRIAVLAVGYENGFLRNLSNRAEVLIHGQRAPVRGRICMNACMVELTDLHDAQEVQPGDEVVLMGCQQSEEISVEEVAGWMGTISYEVFCLFGKLNQRVYINSGRLNDKVTC